MTFSDPVETLNETSATLRDLEPQAPKAIKPAMIAAADELDDQLRRIADLEADLEQLQRLKAEWAIRLEVALAVRIGQMDSDSQASEKMRDSQNAVREVIRLMREV